MIPAHASSPATRWSASLRTVTRSLGARPYVTLLVLLGLVYLPWITGLPLDGTLEGNRLECAREMLRSGDWIVPRLGGALYLAKPPLHPWSIAVLSAPFGDVTLFLGRALSAGCALLLSCLVLRWGTRELGRRAGLFAALAFGGAVLVAEKAMRAELESEFALLAGLALFLFFEAGRGHDPVRAWRLRFGAGLALGAATLTKGPPVLVVFAATAIALAWSGRRRAWLVTAASVLVIALGCALLWVVPVCARVGVREVWSAFHEQFNERIVHAGRTNVEPFWYYGPALLLALAPACLYAPCLALTAPWRERDERARVRLVFLWGWALVPVVLFSVSSGKEARYLLPMLPAWALLLALGWRRARVGGRFVRWRSALVRALSVATWCVPVIGLGLGWSAFPEARGVVVVTALGAIACRGLFAWGVRTERAAVVFVAVAAGVFVCKVAWAETALARTRRAIPVERVAEAVAGELAAGETWVLVGSYRSWWHFSVDRPCLAVADWKGAREAGARVVLVPARVVPAGEMGFEEVGRWEVDGEEYWLVRFGG